MTLKLDAWTDRIAPVRSLIAAAKSDAYVRLVVPTSTSVAPLCPRTSGILNPPPISTASPLETITSLPEAIAASPSITAEALLLTARAASAPVAWQIRLETCSCLEPRLPSARSNSRSLYPAAATLHGLRSCFGSGARVRGWCAARHQSRLPLPGARALHLDSALVDTKFVSSAAPGGSPPERIVSLAPSSSSRTISTTASWECLSISSAIRG